MQPTKRVPEKRRARIAQQWREGATWRQLAAEHRHLRRETLRDICAATGVRADELPMLRQGQRRPWTQAEVNALADMLQRQTPYRTIAERLNRTLLAIEAKANELRSELPRTHTRRTTIRRCLRCRQPFVSEGAHNRICDPCKETEEWRGLSRLPDVSGVSAR